MHICTVHSNVCMLLQVVVKGGQLLPIRSCIEAFLNGDDTALQFTSGPPLADLQQVLASITWAADPDNAANTAATTAAAGVTSPAVAAGHDNPTVTSDGTTRQALAQHDTDCSSVAIVDARQEAQAAGITDRVSLEAPSSASANRTHVQPSDHPQDAIGGNVVHETGQYSLGDAESDAGCDQLVKYLLKELLGGSQEARA